MPKVSFAGRLPVASPLQKCVASVGERRAFEKGNGLVTVLKFLRHGLHFGAQWLQLF
jgi:hypothetical protein